MYRKSVLRNGIHVVTFPMSERESVAIGLWCGVGGRYESDKLKGAAHFLEHILFKGTKKYSCDEIKERVEGVGGSLNAFTTEEQTCYFAKIPSQYVAKTFDVLADMVFFPKIAKKDVDQERGVILEEIKMYYDLPQYFVLEALESLMWPDHPLGKGLAGSIESVSGLTARNLKSFHSKHYVPNNIVVAASGNISHEAIVDMVRKKTSRFLIGQKNDPLPAASGQEGPHAAFYHRPIEQMHVAMGVFGLDAFHKDRYALTLLNIILGGNMSSRLFNEVREKRALAYSIHSSVKCFRDTGLFLIRAGVDNKKVTQAVDVIMNELQKAMSSGVTRSEFVRAKEYFMGQMLLSLEETMDHMLWIGESTITMDRIRTAEEVIRKVKQIKMDDIQCVAQRLLDRNGYNLTVVGPLTKDQEKQMRRLIGIKGV